MSELNTLIRKALKIQKEEYIQDVIIKDMNAIQIEFQNIRTCLNQQQHIDIGVAILNAFLTEYHSDYHVPKQRHIGSGTAILAAFLAKSHPPREITIIDPNEIDKKERIKNEPRNFFDIFET